MRFARAEGVRRLLFDLGPEVPGYATVRRNVVPVRPIVREGLNNCRWCLPRRPHCVVVQLFFPQSHCLQFTDVGVELVVRGILAVVIVSNLTEVKVYLAVPSLEHELYCESKHSVAFLILRVVRHHDQLCSVSARAGFFCAPDLLVHHRYA